MKKKFVAILLTVTLSTALVACSGDSTADTKPKTETSVSEKDTKDTAKREDKKEVDKKKADTDKKKAETGKKKRKIRKRNLRRKRKRLTIRKLLRPLAQIRTAQLRLRISLTTALLLITVPILETVGMLVTATVVL